MTAAEIHKKYEKYVQLLEANKNLVLTGAPGTGKTFMAKEIAWCLIDAMLLKHRYLSSYFEELYSDLQKVSDVVNNQTIMVQFHPSYDYSDFVEGLRPITNAEGQLGFERADGVFKDFCKNSCREAIMLKKKTEAVLNDTTNKKKICLWRDGFIDPTHVASLDGLYESCYVAIIREVETGYYDWLFYQKENSIPKAVINRIQSFAVENTSGDWFNIIDKDTNWADDPFFSCTLFNEFFKTFNEVLDCDCPSEEAIKKKIVTLWEDVPNSPWKQRNIDLNISVLDEVTLFYYALFYWIIIYAKRNYERVYCPSIFIIDEINRGEISKIFGELFFSIDPGYRGQKGKVATQYQNLIKEGDVFKDGFYVPDNVYIIGTMNDIDRSVESMDFAMRRRFAFTEVTAKESFQNMIAESDDFTDIEKDEIKQRMFALNDAILKPELRLGEAYQIGAAYFRKYLYYKEQGMEQAFAMLWENHLKGLLFEYLRGNQNAKSQLEELKKAYDKQTETYDESDTNNG